MAVTLLKLTDARALFMASPVCDPWPPPPPPLPPPLTVGDVVEYEVVGMVVPGRNVDMGGSPRLSWGGGGTLE